MIHLSREVADLVPAVGGVVVALLGYLAARYTAKHSHDR